MIGKMGTDKIVLGKQKKNKINPLQNEVTFQGSEN